MKKTFFLLVVLAFNLGFSQDADKQVNKINIIEKGTWSLIGSASFSFRDSERESINSRTSESRLNFESDSEVFLINLSPQLGYAIHKNLVIGLGIGYGYSKNESNAVRDNGETSFSESNSESLDLFPFIRLYKPVGNIVFFFIQGEARYSKGWSDSKTTNSEPFSGERNEFFIGVRPGFTIFLSKNFALETNIGTLGYTSGSNESDGSNIDLVREQDTDSKVFDFSLNSSNLRFGVSYYF